MSLKPFLPAEWEGDATSYWRDDGDGTGSVVTIQDVAPTLDANKAMKNHNDGYNADRSMRRVASIPWVLIAKIRNEEGWDPMRPDLYPEKMARLLNDPDYAHLRTADGRIGVVNGRIR